MRPARKAAGRDLHLNGITVGRRLSGPQVARKGRGGVARDRSPTSVVISPHYSKIDYFQSDKTRLRHSEKRKGRAGLGAFESPGQKAC